MLTIQADATTERELLKILGTVQHQSGGRLSFVVIHEIAATTLPPMTTAVNGVPAVGETGPRHTLRDQVLEVVRGAKTPLTTNDVTARVRQSRGGFAVVKPTSVYNTLRLAKIRGEVSYDRKNETWSPKEHTKRT